ncbi:hypothetical protein, partial [Eudoraea sp.]|uniref:hypothetical protein n=1 Tax=Eudoraea sp. TaxID=1979955 RepID=UPI003C73C75D
MKDLIASLFRPVADIFIQREARKMAKEAASAKLTQAKAEGAQKLELNKDEWEQLSVPGLDKSWKDEYITVSVVSIFNLILVGGIASAFGHNQVLTGVGLAIQALTTAGVDVGFLLEATVLAGIGLSIW